MFMKKDNSSRNIKKLVMDSDKLQVIYKKQQENRKNTNFDTN